MPRRPIAIARRVSSARATTNHLQLDTILKARAEIDNHHWTLWPYYNWSGQSASLGSGDDGRDDLEMWPELWWQLPKGKPLRKTPQRCRYFA